jgi:1,4-dihydroxy-2-naphthoate octaprenyltransferase
VTSIREWVSGSRPRTLPAAVAPVLVGTALAGGDWKPIRALLALTVAVSLQIGVNYANDYSDGIRGTDTQRVGPVRLVGQGRAKPHVVRAAAFGAFAVAAVTGLVLVTLTSHWWLLLIGLASIAAAWLYTGGPRPYGYFGLGEVFVFIFFGLVPVLGTMYVQTDRISVAAVLAAVGVGSLACAILVTNNLRDIDTDAATNKMTLAVRLGDRRTRHLYLALIAAAFAVAPALALFGYPTALIALVAGIRATRPVRLVGGGATGRELIPALVATGQLLIVYAIALSFGIVLPVVFGS